jgi:SOS-response transcriptional repressor LexA/transcriptional regulator with XRE-family HTH domain
MEKFSEKALIERIIGLRKAYAGERGKSKFAEAIGLTPSTYSYYEKDRVPPIPVLLKICQICNVGIFWLLTGMDEEKSGENQRFSGFNDILDKLKKLSNGNPVSFQAVMAFLDILEQKNKLEESQVNAKAGWIPVLGRTAAGPLGMWSQTNLADSKIVQTQLEQLVERHIHSSVIKTQDGRLAVDLQVKPVLAALNNPRADSTGSPRVSLIQTAGDGDEVCQFIDCPDIVRIYPGCFALQIDGDSMAPRICDGDIVLVSPSVSAGQGQVAVVKVAGAIGVTCKLFRSEEDSIHLVPINEKYDAKIIKSQELLWALAVLCHIGLKSVDL